jgi:hypothetical protein
MTTSTTPATMRPARPPAPNVNTKAAQAAAQLAAQQSEPVEPAEPVEQTAAQKLPPHGERTLAHIIDLLAKPFNLQHVEVKPSATTSDKAHALAIAYVDSRIYQKRLDYLAGVEGWAAHFEPWGPTRLICRLTILGVTKEATGEGSPNDENCGTIAEAQAFKRACSAFGCGRYLYDLPQIWVAYDASKKRIVDAPGAARRIYEQAGLLGTK